MTSQLNKKRTALVIDDDPDIRELLQALLESAGFEVDTMQDGIEAVTLKKPYNVILLDVRMPVFDGRRLTDYWHLTAPELLTRVIMLTGYSRGNAGPTLPTYATVMKPFELQKLLRVVEACAAQTSV
ncbi:MAG: response regulator [Thermoanaerobaculia bacterium]